MKPAEVWPRRTTLAKLFGAGAALLGHAHSRTASASSVGWPKAPIRLALIGDVPYGRFEEQRLLAVFADLATKADFAIHVGDLKSSAEPCSDAMLERRVSLLSRCPIPLVFTPGDNDWLDCWQDKAGSHDPVERLEWIRRRIFNRGQPILGGSPGPATGLAGIEQQSNVDGGPPENLLWFAGGACWITLNLPGSNNGLSASIPDEHKLERDRANRRWLEVAVEQAKAVGARAMVVAIQANPRFDRMTRPRPNAPVTGGSAEDGARAGAPTVVERTGTGAPIGEDRPGAGTATVEDGYAPFRSDLLRAQRELGKPTLLLHGDTHRFRHDWITSELLRVECFGSPFAQSWVSILVDGAADPPFRVSVEHL
jgi:hypothetical protein